MRDSMVLSSRIEQITSTGQHQTAQKRNPSRISDRKTRKDANVGVSTEALVEGGGVEDAGEEGPVPDLDLDGEADDAHGGEEQRVAR